jgi:hypothetical protein
MGLFDLFHHTGPQPNHLVGHIADDPLVVRQGELRDMLMIFHIAEATGIEFHFKMLPTTPQRRKGDRVELTWTPGDDGTANVETMYSAPDQEAIRRRNAEYLHDILGQDARERH